MPIYDYQAFGRDGKNVKGLVESDTVKSARLKLKKQGLIVSSIKEKSAPKSSSSSGASLFGGKVSQADLTLTTRQFASLIKANIPLVDALNALIEQTDSERLKVVLSQVRQDVNEGSSLSKALAKHPKIFDNIYCNMVDAGESSGTLTLVLLRLADLKEAQARLNAKVRGEMMYPILMIVFAAVLLVLIFTFVIPKLVKIFDSMDKPIPPSTQILIAISEQLTVYWYFYLGAAVGSFILFKRYINSEKGRLWWDGVRLKFPIFGTLNRMIAVNRFSRTMATLLGSGVPILTSMKIAQNLVNNVHIESAIEGARGNITEGQSIADPLRKSGHFPPLVTHMIAIGEKTGEISDMLKNVADTYEEQINAKISGMTSLLGPLMIMGMAGVVGFIVMSIFVPLLEISNIQ